MLTTQEIIKLGSAHLNELKGHIFDVLTVEKPVSIEAARNLAKIISKLSPLLGNLIEFNIVEFLNDQEEYKELGEWKRQDPGFPDTIFTGIDPTPGFEVKAWFPLATEITARFKDSQNHFEYDQTYVCMLAWVPEMLIYGKPKIIDVAIFSGASVAKARDDHYHNPPDYIVLEPRDTTARTRNLQQTNTNGFKWQAGDFETAEKLVKSWGENGGVYSPSAEYQKRLRQLMATQTYRGDTNYAKMDRIEHAGIEAFKDRVLAQKMHGFSIKEWASMISADADREQRVLEKHLAENLKIRDRDIDDIIE